MTDFIVDILDIILLGSSSSPGSFEHLGTNLETKSLFSLVFGMAYLGNLVVFWSKVSLTLPSHWRLSVTLIVSLIV